MGDEAMICRIDLCGTETTQINGGYCSYHQRERAEAAETDNAALRGTLRDEILRAEEAEAQLTVAAAAIVTLTAERDEAQRTIEAQARQLEELGKAYDAMRDTVMDLTP